MVGDGDPRRRRRSSSTRINNDINEVQPWDSISQQGHKPRDFVRTLATSSTGRMSSHESRSRRRYTNQRSHKSRTCTDIQEGLVESIANQESSSRGGKVRVVYVDIDNKGHNRRERDRRGDTITAMKATHTKTNKKDREQDAKPVRSRSGIRSYSNAQSTKRSSFLSLFSLKLPSEPAKSVRRVECLACMSAVPQHTSAKLKCGHRMCHSCLKRVFKLSIVDPQHMPPKCCTADHIPLKHVDKLFRTEFKILWNRKFQEYTTVNRIYCPTKRCGEWIMPRNLKNQGERGYGKCSKCGTKVCTICNAKWHGRRTCPKDEATNALLETAKQAGWQRCYSCRTMVELREGCNHMTCRCTAEFCMICGSKWKTCNCPWFSYEVVERERVQHMRNHRVRGYDEELRARREQENDDATLARRMARLAMVHENYGRVGPVGGIDVSDLNTDGTNLRPRVQPVEETEEFAMRRPRRVVERDGQQIVVGDAMRAVDPGIPRINSLRRRHQPVPRAAVLAGIARGARGSDRVNGWAQFVEPIEPPDGVH